MVLRRSAVRVQLRRSTVRAQLRRSAVRVQLPRASERRLGRGKGDFPVEQHSVLCSRGVVRHVSATAATSGRTPNETQLARLNEGQSSFGAAASRGLWRGGRVCRLRHA